MEFLANDPGGTTEAIPLSTSACDNQRRNYRITFDPNGKSCRCLFYGMSILHTFTVLILATLVVIQILSFNRHKDAALQVQQMSTPEPTVSQVRVIVQE